MLFLRSFATNEELLRSNGLRKRVNHAINVIDYILQSIINIKYDNSSYNLKPLFVVYTQTISFVLLLLVKTSYFSQNTADHVT